jgi:uncharacterized membrane protein YbhN (UPF0104 family)
MIRRWWPWVRILAGAGILAVLMWRLGTAAFLDGLRVIDVPTLAVALALGVLTTVSSAWRWCLVARGMGLGLPLGTAVADYYRALFLNAALPGGVLGDVHRAVRHGQDVGDVGRGVRAVVMERFAGQAALFGLGAVVLLTVPSPVTSGLRPAAAPWTALVVAVVVAAITAGLGWLAVRRPASWWGRTCRVTVRDVRAGLLARGVWPGVTLSSVVALAGHLATFLLAARVAGVVAPVRQLVPLLLLALLAMAVPVNIGGWGPREGAAAWAFAAAGLGAAQGLTTSVVYGVFALVASTPGVVVLVARWVARRRAGAPDDAEDRAAVPARV